MTANSWTVGQNSEPYRVLLAVEDAADLQPWIKLAIGLCNHNCEIRLRGMVVIPPGNSLSEGATQAQQLRQAFDQIERDFAIVHEEVEVRVDYRPLERIIEELPALQIDTLLVQWAGPLQLTGGVSTDDILRYARCDVVLVGANYVERTGPVLLALRGGPNLSLGVRVARELATNSTITLFHAANKPSAAPPLGWLMRAIPNVGRTVTAIGDIPGGIEQESVGHRAIVLGATSPQLESTSSSAGSVI